MITYSIMGKQTAGLSVQDSEETDSEETETPTDCESVGARLRKNILK